MLNNDQLRPSNIDFNTTIDPGVANIVLPNTFEQKFGKLLSQPMPQPISFRLNEVLDKPYETPYADGLKVRGLFRKSQDNLKRTDSQFNNPINKTFSLPYSEVEPYTKHDSNYDSGIGAAFGQAGKGVVVGGLLGTTTAPGLGTAIGAGVGGTLGFFSGLLGVSGRQGYLIGTDNRKLNAERQSGGFNRLTGLINNTIDRAFEAGVGGTAALITTPFGAFSGKDMYAWGDNAISEKLKQGLEESEYRAHLSDAYLDKGPIAKFFTGEGVQNELADMLGFTLGMMVGVKGQGLLNKAGGTIGRAIGNTELSKSIVANSGNLFGQLTPSLGKQASSYFLKGTKLARQGEASANLTFSSFWKDTKNVISGADNFEQYGLKLANAFQEGGYGLKALSSMERTALASYGEARVESAESYKDIYDTAIKNGHSISEATRMATAGANKTLGMNVLLLSLTNQFGLNQLMRPAALKNLSSWFTKDWVFDGSTKRVMRNLLSPLKNAGKGVVYEGFAEELGQFAISQAAKNQQLKMYNPYNPVHTSFLPEFIDAYKEGIFSDEGTSNWFGGAMFGAAMGLIGLDGGIAGIIGDRKEARNLKIPDSIKTSVTKFSSAVDFISKHTTPFNGQLFQSYKVDPNDETLLVPDPTGDIRALGDPMRVVKLTQALHQINSLSREQSDLILSDLRNALTSEDPKIQSGAKTIASYLDTLDESLRGEGQQSLKDYLDKNVSEQEKKNTIFLLASLSEQQQGFEQDSVGKLAMHMLKSNYVYDYVANGVEDMLFDELDLIEQSISDPTSESAQKDQFEFFGKLYKSTELSQAKQDIAEFRKGLQYQVDTFKSVYNRYGDPLTIIEIKNKEGKRVAVPITVDLKEVMRSTIRQDMFKDKIQELESKKGELETKLLSTPDYKESYLNIYNTSDDVLDDVAKSFKKKNSKELQEYEQNKAYIKIYNDVLKSEYKTFDELTDKEKLIKEALKAQQNFNATVENPPVVTPDEQTPVETLPVADETEDGGATGDDFDPALEAELEAAEREIEEELKKQKVEEGETPVAPEETPQIPEELANTPKPELPFTDEDVEKDFGLPPADPKDQEALPANYKDSNAKPKFSQEALFRTYSADVRNGVIQPEKLPLVNFLNNLRGNPGFYLLPIPLDSNLGKAIVLVNEPFYNTYPFDNLKGKELIYLFVDAFGNAITTDGKEIKVRELLERTTFEGLPGLIYEKSSVPVIKDGKWMFGATPLEGKFSKTELFTEEEQNKIINNYIEGLKEMHSAGMAMLNSKDKNFANLKKDITFISHGVEHSFDPSDPVAERTIPIDPDVQIILPSDNLSKDQKLKLGTPYVYNKPTGMYFQTIRSRVSDAQIDKVIEILNKLITKQIPTAEEIEYLTGVVNLFTSPTANNAAHRNSIGIIEDEFVINPHSVNVFRTKNPQELKDYLKKNYYHYVSKSKLADRVRMYKDLVTGEVYQNYEEYLKQTQVLRIRSRKDINSPTRSNINIQFASKPTTKIIVPNKADIERTVIALDSLNIENFHQSSIQAEAFNAAKSDAAGEKTYEFTQSKLFPGFTRIVFSNNIIYVGDAEGYAIDSRMKSMISGDMVKNYNMFFSDKREGYEEYTREIQVNLEKSPEGKYFLVLLNSPQAKDIISSVGKDQTNTKEEEAYFTTSKSQSNISLKSVSIIHTKSDDIILELNKLKTPEEKLSWLKNNNLITPIIINGKSYNSVDYSDRIMVLAKIGKYNIPFYISTGRAGKKTVKAGNWYVVFGIGESGWINKGTEDNINSQYNFPIFQKIAKILNEGVGTFKSGENNVNGKIIENIGYLEDDKNSITEFNAQMGLPITPAKNHTESKVFYENAHNILKLVNDELSNILENNSSKDQSQEASTQQIEEPKVSSEDTAAPIEEPKVDEADESEDYNPDNDYNPEDFDDQERAAFDSEVVDEVENIEEFRAWLALTLPQFKVLLEQDYINGRAQGQLFKNLIRIYKGAGKGTGYHEAFEAVWAYMLNDEQKQSMLDEFKSRPGSFKYYSNGKIIKYADATDYQAKEMMAEGFIDFMNTKKLQPKSPKANNFFMRLFELLKEFISSLRSFFSSEKTAFETIDEVYTKLAKGDYSKFKIDEYTAETVNRDRFEVSSNILYADVARFESLLHDRFVREVFEKNNNFNIHDLIESAEENLGSITDFINENLNKVIDDFAKDYLDNVKKDKALLNSLINLGEKKSPETYSFVKNPQTGLTIIDEIKKRFVKNFIKRSKISEFITPEDINEEHTKNTKDSIVPSNEINPTANVNNVVRYLLSNLYYLDIDGKRVKSTFGDLVEYDKVPMEKAQKELVALLTNAVPIYDKSKGRVLSLKEVFIKRMKTKAVQDRDNTWLKDLLDKLKLESSNPTLSEIKLQTAFLNSFKKTEHIPLNLMSSPETVQFRNAIHDSNAISIIESWKASLKSNKSLGLKEETNERVIPKPSTVIDLYDLFTNTYNLDLGKQTTEKNKILNKIATYLKQYFLPEITVDNLFNNLAGSDFRDLAAIVAKEKNFLEKSFRNQDGAQQFSVINPTAVSDVFNTMSQSTTVDTFLKTQDQLKDSKGNIKVGLKNNIFLSTNTTLNPVFKGSYVSPVIQYLFNGTTDLTTFSGKSFSSMTYYDKLLFKFNAFMYKSAFSLPINSDKSMENAISFGANIVHDDFINFDDLAENSVAIKKYYLPLLEDELDQLINTDAKEVVFYGKSVNDKKLGYFQDIINFSEKDFEKISSGKISIKKFAESKINEISAFIRKDTNLTFTELEKADAFKYITIESVLTELNKLRNAAASKDAIINYVEKILQDTEGFNRNQRYGTANDVLGSVNADKEIALKKAIGFLLKHPELMVRSMPGVEWTQQQKQLGNEIFLAGIEKNIIEGLPKFFYQKIYLGNIKRMTINYHIFNMNVQNLIYGSINMYKDKEFAKRASFIASSKQPIENSEELNRFMNDRVPRFDLRQRDGALNYISYADPVTSSSSLIDIAESMYDSYKAHKGLSKQDIENLIGASFSDQGKFVKLQDDFKDKLIGPYTTLKLADAQAFMMPDGYFDFMFKSSKVTKDFMKQFDYEMAFERNDRSKKGTPKEYAYTYPNSPEGKALKKKDDEILSKGNPGKGLQVLKPQGSGYQMGYNTLIPIFLKNSVAPLFWSRVKNNPQLRKSYIMWQKNQIDLIGFDSGQKMGNITKDGKLTALYNEDGTTNSIVPPIQSMDMKYFGLQVETSAQMKGKVTRGVQITKIITSNLSNFYNKKGYEHVTKLVDEYYQNLNAIWKKGEEELFKKLGIKYNSIEDTYEIDNLEFLVDTFKEEVKRLDLPINVEDLFEVDPTTGKLPYSLDASTERNRIEYIVNSILDSTLIHQKVKGTQSPQVSSVFERTLSDNQKAIYLKNGVYTEVPTDLSKLSEKERKSIRISSTDLKILKDGTIEVYLPSYLEGVTTIDGKIDPELLNLIGYRIPTQSFGQVEKIRVKGFLNKSHGDMIVVPAELVGKSGSDFDIDKLTIYYPNFFKDKDGNFKYYRYSSNPEKLQDRYNQYIRSQSRKVYKELISQYYGEIDQKYKDLGLGERYNKEITWVTKTFKQLPDPIQSIFYDLNKELSEKAIADKVQGFQKGILKTVHFMHKAKEIMEEHSSLEDDEVLVYDDSDVGNEIVPLLKKMIKEYETALADYGFVKGNIEDFVKRLNEFNDFKNETITYIKDDVADNIANDLGLMSFTDFSQLPVEEQNSKEALENRNIELMSALITLKENRLQHLAPNSADTIKSVDLDINPGAEDLPSYSLSSFVETTVQRHILVDAKNLVGAAALHVTGHSTSQVSNIFIHGKKGVGILPSFKELKRVNTYDYDLSGTFDSKGRLISSNLSEFLSAFVDAAKDPFAVRLNLNFNTINQAMLLIRLGLPIEETMHFINQDTIREFISEFNKETSIMKKSAKEADSKVSVTARIYEKYLTPLEPKLFDFVKEIKNPYKRNMQIIDTAIKFIDQKVKENTFYNSENLKKGVNIKDSKDKQTSILISVKAMTDFMAMEPLARELGTLNQVMNIESKKTKSLAENTLLLNKYDDLINKVNRKGEPDPTFGNVEVVFRKTHLKSVLGFRSNFRHYVKDLLKTASGELASVIDTASNIISRKYMGAAAQIEYIDKFTNFVLSYVMGISDASTYQVKDLLFSSSPTNLRDRLHRIKTNPEYTKFYNEFGRPFDNLSINISHKGPIDIYNIRLLLTKEATVQRNIDILKYESIYKKAEQNRAKSELRKAFYREVKEIIDDLVTVSIHQSGTFSTFASLSTTLPAEVYSKKVTELMETANHVLSAARDHNGDTFNLLWKQFHQNFWSDKSIVKIYNRKLRYENGYYLIQGNISDQFIMNYTYEENEDMDYDNPYAEEFVKKGYFLQKAHYEPIRILDEFDKETTYTIFKPIRKLGNRLKNGKGTYGIEVYMQDTSKRGEEAEYMYDDSIIYELSNPTLDDITLIKTNLGDLSGLSQEEVSMEFLNEDPNIVGENISSRGSEFAKKLTNVGNNVGLIYKGKNYVNSEHAYQTWKSGEFNQTGYDLKGGKVRGGKLGDTFSIMIDILTEKLKQHPELVDGINERGGLAYIKKSTHNVIGDNFWETVGQNKFIEALLQAAINVGIDNKTNPPNIAQLSPEVVMLLSVLENNPDTASVIEQDVFDYLGDDATPLTELILSDPTGTGAIVAFVQNKIAEYKC